MKRALLWLLLAFSLFTASARGQAANPPPTDPNAPWDRSGTAAGALVNGIQASLLRANLGNPATGTLTFSSIMSRYNATYGPYLHGINFDMTHFMGTKQNPGTIFLIIKILLTLIVAFVFVSFAFSASQHRASLSDLGWSMAKTVIAVFFICFPGFFYALLILVPVWLAQSFGHSGADAHLDPNSTPALRSARAIQEGIAGAEAVINGGMAAIGSGPADRVILFDLAEAIKELGKNVGLPPETTGIINLPKKINGAYPDSMMLDDVDELGVPLDDSIPHTVTDADRIATKLAAKKVLRECVIRWRDWKKGGVPFTQINVIKKIQSDGEDQLSLVTTDTDATAEILRKEKMDAYNAMLKLATYQLFSRQIMNPVPVVNPVVAMDLEAHGLTNTASFITANQANGSTTETVINVASNFVLGLAMPAIGAVWMAAIEIMMIQMLVMAIFWIHPKTEASALKAGKTLLGVAFFLPLYLIAFLAVQKLLGVLMPGNPIAATGSSGFVSGTMNLAVNVVNIVTWPMRACYAITFAVLAPVLAFPCAWLLFKAFASGGTIIAGAAKTALTSAGVATALATPVFAGAARAAGAGLSAAGGAVARPGGVAGRAIGGALRSAGTASRAAGRGIERGGETMASAFGENDKYLSPRKSLRENAGGVLKAGHKIVNSSGALDRLGVPPLPPRPDRDRDGDE